MHLRHAQKSLAKSLKQSLRQVTWDKDVAVKAQDFDRASELRDQELELETKLQTLNSRDTAAPRPVVQVEDIAQVVESWTGIPASQITKSESAMLMKLEETLHQRIIGQESAVNAVAKAIRRARVGLGNTQRPIASFIFCGPTGVGKTELTKALADTIFGSEDSIIRLDMSEYMEKHSVARLVGAPPGYVGYEEGGQLSEAVRRHPYSVVLLDEVEKAHPDVFNILLQVLDDGRITDSQGRTVDFSNTVIVMTSNIGSDHILDVAGDTTQFETMRERVLSSLRSHFRPEFLNRVDDLIIFHALSKAELRSIVTIQLKRLYKLLADQKITLQVSESAIDYVAEMGYDPVYGARPLKRAIQRELENPIATKILENTFVEGCSVVIDYIEERLKFQVNKADVVDDKAA